MSATKELLEAVVKFHRSASRMYLGRDEDREYLLASRELAKAVVNARSTLDDDEKREIKGLISMIYGKIF